MNSKRLGSDLDLFTSFQKEVKLDPPLYLPNNFPCEVILNILSFGITFETDPEKRKRQYEVFTFFKSTVCPYFNIDTTELYIKKIDTIGFIYANMFGKNIPVPMSIHEEFNRLTPQKLNDISKSIFPRSMEPKYFSLSEKNEKKITRLLESDSLDQLDPEYAYGKIVMYLVKVNSISTEEISSSRYKPFNEILQKKEKLILKLWDLNLDHAHDIPKVDILAFAENINEVFSVHQEIGSKYPRYQADHSWCILVECLRDELNSQQINGKSIYTLLKAIILLRKITDRDGDQLFDYVFGFYNQHSAIREEFPILCDKCLPHIKAFVDDYDFMFSMLEAVNSYFCFSRVIESIVKFIPEGIEHDQYKITNYNDLYQILHQENEYYEFLKGTCGDDIDRLIRIFDLCSIELKCDFFLMNDLHNHFPFLKYLEFLDPKEKSDIIARHSIQYVPKDKPVPEWKIRNGIKNDSEILLAIIKNDYRALFFQVYKKFREDRKFVQDAIKINPEVYLHLFDDELLDHDFLKAFLDGGGKLPVKRFVEALINSLLQFNPDPMDDLLSKFLLSNREELGENKEFFLELILMTTDGTVIRFASKLLQDNKELVYVAIKHNPLAYWSASERLQNDEDIKRVYGQSKAFGK